MLSDRKIRVLCVEDEKYDRELIRFALEKESDKFVMTEATDRQTFERLLASEAFDIVITDFNILGFTGMEVIHEVKRRYPDLPIIVVTGTGSEEIAVRCLKEGVDDYVIKTPHHIARLPYTIIQVLAGWENRKRLKEREEILFAVVNNIADGILMIDTQRTIKFCNPMAEKLLGVPGDKLVGTRFEYPLPTEEPCEIELPNRVGGQGVAEIRTTEMIWEGRPHRVVALRDITERKHAEEKRRSLEEQLRRARRLEMIGQLAGGIAHDFNNLLSIILGYGEAVLTEMAVDNPFRTDLIEIVKAGRHGAELTRQLLAFSRRQAMEPQLINLNEVIVDLEKMLRRLIGGEVTLKLSLGKGIYNIFADPGQVEQVIMNLLVNARDAMPNGGEIIIETKEVELDEFYADTHVDVKPGKYILLSVSDNGVGMDENTLSHIFEPFFTTKEKSGGTGLGLATVYGIVKQSGGEIGVYSEVGKGTTFKIYLPKKELPADKRAKAVETPEIVGGNEHILVVEDEPSILDFMEKMLSYLGYKVSVASSAEEVIKMVEEKNLKPDLVITDVIMPNMSGRELVSRLRNKLPNLKVLYMSGYTHEIISRHGILKDGVHFIQKPFTMTKLSAKIREVLLNDREKR